MDGFRCICPMGYAKPYCDREINACDLNADKCKNGARCEISPMSDDGFNCACLEGFDGEFCEEEEKVCDRNSVKCVNVSLKR